MIKLNLLGQKKPLRLPVVLGIDLGQLNIKMIVVFLCIYYFVPDNFVYNRFEQEQEELRVKIAKNTKVLNGLKKKKKDYGPIKKRLQEFNKKMELLKERSQQINTLLKYRSNPIRLLERVAQNTPEDLWFEELKISDSKAITINGRSTSFKSIGNFVTLANESIFFNKSLTLESSVVEKDLEQKSGKRIEVFTVVGSIESFGISD